MKIIKVTLLTTTSLISPAYVSAITFDTSLLAGISKESDLTRFNADSSLPVGTYEFDTYVNNEWKGRFPIKIGENPDNIALRFIDANRLGIDLADIDAGQSETEFISIDSVVKGGKYNFDISTLSLSLTVPQANILKKYQGYIDSSFWNRGVDALILSYNSNYYTSKSFTGDHGYRNNIYTNFNSGINLMGWQFRDDSYFSYNSKSGGKLINNSRYVRRAIPYLKSNLIAGDFTPSGNIFDTVGTRGVSLSSDLSMLPSSQQGFSPVVHGIAQSNALVKIFQNGNLIHQKNVPPGNFSIETIQPTGSAGDLQVVIQEANGQESSYIVPFSSVPNMLKNGLFLYDAVIGKVNENGGFYSPFFIQTTMQYGFNNLLTGYIGTIYSNDYQSYLLGSGWNFPFGAVSLDVTHADTYLNSSNNSGESIRLAYSKFMNTTNTNFTLAAYRYSTKGFYSFSDAIYAHHSYNQLKDRYSDLFESDQVWFDIKIRDAMNGARPKNTFSLNLNQRLGNDFGTLYLSGVHRDYWTGNSTSKEYQLGYSDTVLGVNYNISASKIHKSLGHDETRYFLSFNLPLDIFEQPSYLSSSISMAGNKYQQSTLNLSGSAMNSNRLSYSFNASNNNDKDNMLSSNLTYRSDASTIGASWSEASNFRQAGLSARGSLVATPKYLLASNEAASTMVIVESPEAEGLSVNGDETITTNANGLALVPYAVPYRQNTLTLSDTPNRKGADVINNIEKFVPYYGSVNYLKFETDNRQNFSFKAFRLNNKPLPFGAEVLDENDDPLGFVGQASLINIRSDKKPTKLKIKLHDGVCVITNPVISLSNTTNKCIKA